MEIKKRFREFKKKLPEDIVLVAVSKTKPIEAIQEAYDMGQRIFGENKALEMQKKYEELPKDIQWHMIGNLQSNKVKYIAAFVDLIHSVDRFKILEEINKRAIQNRRTIKCLLQVHIAQEESKFGFNEHTLQELLESDKFKKLQNVQIVGLMGMATNTENQEQIAKEFRLLRLLFEQSQKYFDKGSDFKVLSMGMSQDYEIAIKEGSNMIRIGSYLFGNR